MNSYAARKAFNATTQMPRTRKRPDLTVVVPQGKSQANYQHPKYQGIAKLSRAANFQAQTTDAKNGGSAATSKTSCLVGASETLNPFTDTELAFLAENNLDQGLPQGRRPPPQNDDGILDCNYFGYFHGHVNHRSSHTRSPKPSFKDPFYVVQSPPDNDNDSNNKQHLLESPRGTTYSEIATSSLLTAQEAFEMYICKRRGVVRQIDRQSLAVGVGAGVFPAEYEGFWKLVGEDEGELMELETWRRRKGVKG